MSHPPFVVRSAEVPASEGHYPAPFDAEKLSLGRDLGRAAGSRALGAWHERLSPGRRTSFTHAHLREEELVYVLSGAPTLRWIEGGEARECLLAPGDFVAFPAGTGLAHTVWNRSEQEVELLVVGERRAGERASYPEDGEWQAWRAQQAPLRAWSDVDGPRGDARGPATRIETSRLVLRPWAPEDAHDLLDLVARNQAHLSRWMAWAAKLPTLDEQLTRILQWDRHFWAGEDLVYAIREPDGRPVGAIGLHNRVGSLGRELGYWIAQDREGRGYVSEAVSALVRLGFEEYGLDRMEIHCDPGNQRSRAIPERLGFSHEATLPRRAQGLDGQPSDSVVYALYRSVFEGSAATMAPMRAFDALGRRLV